MGKKGIVIALFCIISFSPLSVMAGGSGTLIEKGSADVAVNVEAYVAQWESGKMVLKRTDSFDRFSSIPPYEVADAALNAEAYVAEWESGNLVLKRTYSFDRFMSTPPYEVADTALNAEAYVAEWESGNLVLKRTYSFDRFMSTPPYEVAEEAYSIDRDSITMRPTLKSDNINRLISMPSYEASVDVTSYSHSRILSAGVSQPSEPSFDSEASFAPQQCDWCYEQTS
jgi:hypothetical protein